MKNPGSVLGFVFLGAGALFGLALPPAAPQLKYAVVITRHGVRAPTWTPERLNAYSSAPWPDWGVPPAYLTPHGRSLMKLMGAYYRQWFSTEGLLNPSGCTAAGRVYVWADKDQRTIETGRAIAEGLMPACAIAVHSLPEGQADPLFDPIGTGVAKPDNALAVKAVQDRLGAEPQKLIDTHHAAFNALQSVLAGGGSVSEKLIDSAALGVSAGGKSVELRGPFGAASTLSENLLLEYTNGMRGNELGWGRVNADNLYQVLELHSVYADLMRRTPYLAQAGASNLLAHVLRSMEQAVTGKPSPGALGQPGDALLILSGHDTNLSNISGMLGLSWSLPGYQGDDTPPGGALILSLWRNGTSQYFVRTQYIAQTLDQMRNATGLTGAAPPAKRDVLVPGCEPKTPRAECAWPAFERALQKAINPAFTSFAHK